MPRPTLIAATLLLASCGSDPAQPAQPAPADPAPSGSRGEEPAPPSQGSDPAPETILDGRAAIVPEAQAPDFTSCYGLGRYESFFTPSAADVAGLGEALSAGLTREGVSRPLSGYHMHVMGVVREGRRLLMVGAFCHQSPAQDWRINPVCVDDGGDCYFEAEVDPATSEVVRLSPHGDA